MGLERKRGESYEKEKNKRTVRQKAIGRQGNGETSMDDQFKGEINTGMTSKLDRVNE